MDIARLFDDYGVEYITESSGHRHSQMGWVNVPCPFCTGNPGYHLGYNTDENYFNCWRCGGHPINKTLTTLLKVNYHELKDIERIYNIKIHQKADQKVSKLVLHKFKMPPNIPLKKQHINYLENRNFDPEYLQKYWNISGTDIISMLDGMNFKNRIVVPIEWNKQMVSWQTRDITDKAIHKYVTCGKDREIVHHKHILYGKQNKWKDTGFLVEGVTDVWRLGPMSFATFGIKYKAAQLRIIAKRFKRVFILFDCDPQAIVQAAKIKADLLFRGVEAIIIPMENDPGSMKQIDANNLIKDLL